jgi:hypothetical protein
MHRGERAGVGAGARREREKLKGVTGVIQEEKKSLSLNLVNRRVADTLTPHSTPYPTEKKR